MSTTQIEKPWLSDHYTRMSIADLTTPKHGRVCYANSWWEVTPDDEVLFYVRGGACTPQCNTIRSITERLCMPGCTARLIEMAYVPMNVFGA